jgi:tetraacyldisaccharide 4'-kinase
VVGSPLIYHLFMSKASKQPITILYRNLLLLGSYFYSFIMQFRNFLYNHGIKKTHIFHQPIISIGNLSLGGTGKTPCIAYLVRLLQLQAPIIILSRGYKRKTSGFRVAQAQDTALTLGDEPYQVYRQLGHHPHIHVIVSEDRVQGITRALNLFPHTHVILLDDAFQQRKIQPTLHILLTTFQRPFFTDHVVPAGILREPRGSAKRADIVIVTKCPDQLSETTQSYYQQRIAAYCRNPQVPVFFTRINYHTPVPVWPEQNPPFSNNILLVTGIAHPAILVKYVSQQYNLVKHIAFRDHHYFTNPDIQAILTIFHQIPYTDKCLLTTEKDSVRLLQPSIKKLLKNIPVFYLPINMELLEAEKRLKQLIFEKISQ